MLKHVISHIKAFVHQLEGREEDVLEELELSMIAMRHIAAEHGDLVFRRHDPVAVTAHDLPDVRILLVRHDAGSGGEFVRELDEPVIRTHVHAAVGRKLVERQGDSSHC